MSATADTSLLIVEDDPDIRMLFSTALSVRGYHVDTASNGDEALAALASDPLPTAIVADLHMPVMDGWKFLSALHADPRLSTIPVVVLTAADDPEREAPRPDTILIKPVSTQTLIEAIETAIARGSRSS
ncbi:MAG: response regulator [Deltaproteobacteria bacterium]|nr:MAG: response regulator [Deltaproteobacteria bacterium]TMQ19696.1 MAG: response regulator [Deltaproteobacteria bacterium]